MKKLFTPLLILIFGFSAGMLNTSFEKPKLIVPKQDSAINLNQTFLKLFSIGQTRLLSDILWIITLLESDTDHYKSRDLGSWMYRRFNSIIYLDPKFYNAYLFGGQYLGIVKDDLEGAADIYLKGLKQYPEDYNLLFHSGFLFAFEKRDSKQAVGIYEKLVTFPQAPPYMQTLLYKLKFQSNSMSPEDTLESLKIVLQEIENQPVLKGQIESDIYALKSFIDLKCLSEGRDNCEKIDFEGNPYIFKNGEWVTPKAIKPYGIKYKD
ncbi:MAG: hypothetical protein CME65_09470 [Halobacteriovoraceae bacterium]|nr:hypothetical protein [Halobacteriovoraceae bacterium]